MCTRNYLSYTCSHGPYLDSLHPFTMCPDATSIALIPGAQRPCADLTETETETGEVCIECWKKEQRRREEEEEARRRSFVGRSPGPW